MNHQYINQLNEKLFANLKDGETLSSVFEGESSFFLRFNGGKVRQNTEVTQGSLSLSYAMDNRGVKATVPVVGDLDTDLKSSEKILNELREMKSAIPEDPFLVEPKDNGTSETVISGELLENTKAADALLKGSQELDMTGIYAAGKIQICAANSAGTNHWFEVDNFSVDYSLISAKEHMSKGSYGGTQWSQEEFLENRNLCAQQLHALNRPEKKVKPGHYKTYLAPAAVAEVLGTISWGGMSTSALKQRQSPWLPYYEKDAKLNEKFNLRENFALGLNTPFNEEGELSAEVVSLIENGKLISTLTSQKTAKEYSVESNGASGNEMLRSTEILTGGLSQSDILKELGEGLYINQLHYLNWSELNAGRMTGMTRYACFWVENGELAAPIENLRFDDSIYSLFGEAMIDLTDFTQTTLEVGTYGSRHLGGYKTPGLLLERMNFAL